MKVYIAAAFPDREAVTELQILCKKKGYKISGDWTKHKSVKPYEQNKVLSKRYAKEDLKNVRNCDVFILLSNKEGSTGAHVELGAALALSMEKGIPKVYIIGDHLSRSLFYFHPVISLKKDMNAVFEDLERPQILK